ncbi:hypothetical protein [Thiomonas sp.]|uniref:hypothetical protein n=1 Tax=Thiomonas sp. TaxID=2047785 RepID=UPI0025844395|nr:hypothetical protein [Thiomonas sp.]
MRPKWARRPANRPDWPPQSLRRRVWAARFFEISVPDAFEKHFFNGLLDPGSKLNRHGGSKFHQHEHWVVMCEAARIASEARGYTVQPENFKGVRRFENEAERLADIAQDELHASTPQLWAWYMSAELRERNPGMDYAAQGAAEVQILRTFGRMPTRCHCAKCRAGCSGRRASRCRQIGARGFT